MTPQEIQDAFDCPKWLIAQGYLFSYGDGYTLVSKGEWHFKSWISSECQLEALRHSGVRNWDTLRWMQRLVKTVEIMSKWE
jgi:hypothetical protein